MGIRKNVLATLLIVIFTGTLLAQMDVSVKPKQYSGWKARDFAYNRQAEIMNDKNFYQFNLLQYSADKNGKTDLFMNLSAPREMWGFGRVPINFLSIIVNGINAKNLQPNEESFVTWTKPDSAGATVTLNFNGAKLIFDVFMKKGSPLLWFSFRQSEKQLEPIQKASLGFSLVVSKLLRENGTTVWRNAYNRQARTAVRKLEQRKEYYFLNADDRYIVFYDKVLDGSGKEKGFGPSYLTFGMDGVKEVKLNLGNSWVNSVDFNLSPDFKNVTIGIWQQKNAISNGEFLNLFEKEKSSFLFQ